MEGGVLLKVNESYPQITLKAYISEILKATYKERISS